MIFFFFLLFNIAEGKPQSCLGWQASSLVNWSMLGNASHWKSAWANCSRGGSQGYRVFHGVCCSLQMQKRKTGRESESRATCGQPSTPREETPTGGAFLRARSLLQAAPSPSSNDRDVAKKALWAQTGWSWALYESGLWPRALYNNKQLVWSWEAFLSLRHRDWNYFLC